MLQFLRGLVGTRRSELHVLAERLPELSGFCSYPHGGSRHGIHVVIDDFQCIYAAPSPFCPACTVRFLQKYHTRCGICGEPILPFQPVAGHYTGQHGSGSEYPYTHLRIRCCDMAEFWIGWWGLGDVIPITDGDHGDSLRGALDPYIRTRLAQVEKAAIRA